LTYGFSALLGFNMLILSAAPNFASSSVSIAPTAATLADTGSIKQVNPLEVVSSPQSFLNQKIEMTATFDKFSLLGLDYKPAFRDSKNYISFLIRRPDVQNNTDVPLSEMKLIIKRDKAEKLTDLESGDKIEITGKVFSTAMNDPWIDVDNIKILNAKPKKDSGAKKESGSKKF